MKLFCRAHVCAVVTLLAGMAGCSSQSPALQQGAGAEVTFDGLVRVDNAGLDRIWAHPEFNLAPYERIMFEGAGIQYRPVRQSLRNSGGSEELISEANRQRLESIVAEEFRKEIELITSYELVTTPGPDTLVLKVSLVDVVSYVPPAHLSNVDVYINEVGSATLVMELADSVSGLTLARVADRETAKRPGNGLLASNPITNWSDVRRLAARWGRAIRTGVDGMRR